MIENTNKKHMENISKNDKMFLRSITDKKAKDWLSFLNIVFIVKMNLLKKYINKEKSINADI